MKDSPRDVYAMSSKIEGGVLNVTLPGAIVPAITMSKKDQDFLSTGLNLDVSLFLQKMILW